MQITFKLQSPIVAAFKSVDSSWVEHVNTDEMQTQLKPLQARSLAQHKGNLRKVNMLRSLALNEKVTELDNCSGWHNPICMSSKGRHTDYEGDTWDSSFCHSSERLKTKHLGWAIWWAQWKEWRGQFNSNLCFLQRIMVGTIAEKLPDG